ncbi:MAG: Card1-like endonuclease domain-containing protein [Thermodesulfovibrionales bacterium]
MSHIHVCLVSEQTIPNILSIYHFKPERIVFCTTEKMEAEKRADAIIDSLKLCGLNYSNAYDKVQVDQDCLEDCESKLKEEIVLKYKDERVTVNLTGGTKIMVLAAYNIFKEIAEQMIYTPIPKNEFITVFPKKEDCKSPVPLSLKLSVEAYVTAYGVKVKNRDEINRLKSNASKNEKLCRWMIQNYIEIEDILGEFYGWLKDHRDKEKYTLRDKYIPKKQQEIELLRHLGIEVNNKGINKTFSKYEIRFLTGDWLSDFCFNEISKLSVDDCVTGIKLISPKEAENEFDVMFTKDNALYIVECKSLKQRHDKDADILYKINSLQHDFGLRVKGFLVSTARGILDDRNAIRESIHNRAKQCNTNVIHPDEIKDIGKWIKNNVKGL